MDDQTGRRTSPSRRTSCVEYWLVGGYSVGIHGYVRATNDLDIWVKIGGDNAIAVERALRKFGFSTPSLSPGLFLAPGNVIRVGVPPLRLEILTSISGVQFDEYYPERKTVEIDGVDVPVISLAQLRRNKQAVGRAKDPGPAANASSARSGAPLT